MSFSSPSKLLNHFLFKKLHSGNIIYNQCWEDPRLDLACLELTPDDTMLVLTSAGCNILEYCLSGVKRIHAVDMNHRQNALLELKIVMIEKLDYDVFFEFFGKGRVHNPEIIYQQSIQNFLSLPSRQFWDKHINLFDAKRKKGFYYSTTSGRFAHLTNFISRHILRLDNAINQLLEAPSLEEQAQIYVTLIEPYLFNPFWKPIWAFPFLLHLVGVPIHQFTLVNKQYPGGAKQLVQDAMRYVMTQTNLKDDNYFWSVYLRGEYTPSCCPAYLKEDNFYRLKKINLRDGMCQEK